MAGSAFGRLRIADVSKVIALPIETVAEGVTSSGPVVEAAIIRPHLALLVSELMLPPETRTRADVTKPISPVADPSDGILFEDPADGSKKYYLPRYKVATIEGEDRYRISFEKSGSTWSLAIDLQKFAAPELGDSARDAAELPHTITVVLTYQRSVGSSDGAIQREHVFATEPNEDGTVRCLLEIADLPQRDELYLALSEDSYSSKLIVRRAAELAVPSVAPAEPSPLTEPLRPVDPIRPAGIRATGLGAAGLRAAAIRPFALREVALSRDVIAAAINEQQTGLASGPDVCSWDAGRLDVFGKGPDGALWHKWFDNGWSGWENLGGVITSEPSAVSWDSGRIDVFAKGTDDALWHKWFDGGWSDWESLGGVITSAPDVCSWTSGRLDVFAKGTDDALWHKRFDSGWSDWESLGGVITSAPGAVSWENGRIDVFAKGTDDALWHKWFDGGWSEWESLGGELSSGPDVSSWAPGRLDVFARGIDGALWQKAFEGAWQDWWSLGGQIVEDPSAVSWDKGRIDVFARGTDDALWHKWVDGAWSEWESLGAPSVTVEEPVATEPSAPETTFDESLRVLEDVAEPESFVFSESAHGYIYGDITGVSKEAASLIMHTVAYGDRTHRYYQDDRDLKTFFSFPDGFKLTRNPENPFNPMMRVAVTTGEAAEVDVTLEYLAVPMTDPDRLAAAAEELARFLPDGSPEGTKPDFEPLQVSQDKLRFSLTLPRADSASDARQERPEATVDLRSGIADSLTQPLEQFQRIYEAMLGGSSVLFQGQVEVDLGDPQPEVLRFSARFDDLAGRLLEQDETSDGDGFEVTLRNVIESPIRISDLRAEYGNDDQRLPVTVTEAPELPMELAPGSSMKFHASVPPAMVAMTDARIIVDLDGIDVLPDREAIWTAILDRSIGSEYDREIQVQGRWILQDQTGDDPIRGVIVEFQRGDSLTLDPDTPDGTAKVKAPIDDLVMRREQESTYQYRLTVIRASGQTKDDAWRTEDSSILALEID